MSSDAQKSASNVIKYYNASGANLPQETYVLDHASLQGGTVIDKDGIDDGDIGMINIVYTRVFQPLHAQLNADILSQALPIETPVYVSDPLLVPASDIHVTPLAGDYFIGKLWESQGTDVGIRVQLLPPIPYSEMT